MAEKRSLLNRCKVAQRILAIGCSLLVLTCSLATPLAVRKSTDSTSNSAHPGKVLRTALPDENRMEDGNSVTLGTARVVHAILRVPGREPVATQRITPIPSVLCLRPASDRAPPRS